MIRSNKLNSTIVKLFKFITVLIGLLFIFLSLVIFVTSVVHYAGFSTSSFSGSIEIFSAVAALITGIALVSFLPESFRVRFIKPLPKAEFRQTYGFITLISIGVGATIGSPLFIILPLNVVQYAFVSIVSLIIAGSLSFLISKLYSFMFVYTSSRGKTIVGGPGFVRETTREKSLRYFIARFSMWIANTALAAFSAIFFYDFVFQALPSILSSLGLDLQLQYLIETATMTIFAFWFIINAFFERRYLKAIGYAQTVMVVVILVLLVGQGTFLGFSGNWNMSGFFQLPKGNLIVDIMNNTGFLFILFFGFQEIQAMSRESKDTSTIPVISRLFKLKPISKDKFFPLSMGLTVIISLAVMIYNALTIYAVHPDFTRMPSDAIPAIYVVRYYLGKYYQIMTLVAFLLATITTFVPAFIAASRHLRSLSEDGFFPRSVKNSSWVFTVFLIGFLTLAGPNFLVNITDFMVLVALGIISLSVYWLRNLDKNIPRRFVYYSVIGGLVSFSIDLSLFPKTPEVVLLGVMAVILSFMMYDVISMGTVGLQIFLLIFDLVGFLLNSMFPSFLIVKYPAFLGLLAGRIIDVDASLRLILLLGALTIFVNIIMDVFVIKRTEYSNKTWLRFR